MLGLYLLFLFFFISDCSKDASILNSFIVALGCFIFAYNRFITRRAYAKKSYFLVERDILSWMSTIVLWILGLAVDSEFTWMFIGLMMALYVIVEFFVTQNDKEQEEIRIQKAKKLEEKKRKEKEEEERRYIESFSMKIRIQYDLVYFVSNVLMSGDLDYEINYLVSKDIRTSTVQRNYFFKDTTEYNDMQITVHFDPDLLRYLHTVTDPERYINELIREYEMECRS